MPQHPLNIMLVEDNDVDFDMVKRGLKKINAQGDLVRAKDGVEALELLDAISDQELLDHPFVILLDINMPRMNGHEFLTMLRRDPRTADQRVIVFTTSNNPRDIEQAYARNALGYMVKPDSILGLRQTLQAIWDFWDRCAHPPGRGTAMNLLH